MSAHLDIIDNINTRYVLLKRGRDYRIIDKLNGTMVIFNDPVINYNVLIRVLIEKGIVIYDSVKDLPKPVQLPVSAFNDVIETDIVKLFLKKLYNEKGVETGTIVSAITNGFVKHDDKLRLERKIQDLAFSFIYPDIGLNLYSDIHSDTVSIVIIKKINDLPNEDSPISETTIYDW